MHTIHFSCMQALDKPGRYASERDFMTAVNSRALSCTRYYMLLWHEKFARALPGFEVLSWVGLAAPAGTPEPILTRVQTELARILDDPQVKQTLATLGSEARSSTPSGMRDFVAGQITTWQRVVREAGIPQAD